MRIRLLLLVSTSLLVACDSTEPVSPSYASYLSASISGSVEDAHAGTAGFSAGPHARRETDHFYLFSKDTLSAPELESQRQILLIGVGYLTIPGDTAVEIQHLDPENGMPGWTALYLRDGQIFAASEGTLLADDVTDTSIRGSFSFRAFRFECDPDCRIPAVQPENADWIHVEGSFVASKQSDPNPL